MGLEVILLVVFFLYGLVSYKRNYLLVTTAIAVVTYMVTKSIHVAVGVLIGSFVLFQFNQVMAPPPTKPDPVGYSEGFQAKDPISIHQRIKTTAVNQVAPSMITGVLESPDILDNLQITNMSPSEEGSSRRVQPAGATGGVAPISTPKDSADQLPASGSYERRVPIANPPLQNGPDNQGILTALIAKGTALFTGEAK